jgi:hypothetical protein
MMCVICTMHKETRSVGFLVEPQNKGQRFLPVWPQNRWLRVSRFGPKTGSYSLVICALKSPPRFLGLGLKTKRATVYRLHHKTNRRMMMTQDTHRDLAACFA